MTCKDCIHYDVCAINGIDVENTTFKKELCCGEFKDKSRIIELPCNVGDKYYKLKAQCTKMRDCYVYECEECCKNCDKQIYIEDCTYKNAWEILNVYKKEQEEIKICKSMRWIFTNKEEAEAKLKELNGNE